MQHLKRSLSQFTYTMALCDTFGTLQYATSVSHKVASGGDKPALGNKLTDTRLS